MLTQYFLRLETIDRLIQMKGTGSPSQLAKKIGISKRAIFSYISVMKEFGAPITFSRIRNSYLYDYVGRFVITFNTKDK